MRTDNTQHRNSTDNAGVPPAPSDAHQAAIAKQSVDLNGSRLHMVRTGGEWLIVSVTEAPFKTK